MHRLRAFGLTALALAACGGDGDDGIEQGPLSAAERREIAAAQESIRSYCRDVGRFRAGTAGPPAAAKARAAERAVEDLIAPARAKPAAAYGPGQTMRQLVGDTAEDLEGTSCSGALVDRLEAALATLAPD